MAKISSLPAASALTGEEIVPIVQEGKTRGVNPADHLAYIATGAEMARDQAADLVQAQNIFADVPLATAEAAIAEGTVFKLIDSGAGTATVRRRTATGSDALYQEATTAGLAASGGTIVGTRRALLGAPAILLGSRLDQRPATFEECGAIDGGESTTAVQRAINSFGIPSAELGLEGRGRVIGTGGKVYRLSSTIFVPPFVDIDAMRATFEVHPDANPEDFYSPDGVERYMFALNCDGDGKQHFSAVNAVPWIRNIRLNNIDWIDEFGGAATEIMEQIKGFYSKGTHGLFNVEANWLWGIYRKPGPGAGEDTYQDHITMSHIYNRNMRGDPAKDWGIQIDYVGDAVDLKHIRTTGHPVNRNSVYISQCLGGSVSHCINGNFLFDRCMGVEKSAFHIEHGYIELQTSEVTLNTGVIFRDTESQYSPTFDMPVPIRVTHRDANNPARNYSVKDVLISTFAPGSVDAGEAAEYRDDDYVDLVAPSSTDANFDNFQRTQGPRNASSARGYKGAAMVRLYGGTTPLKGGPDPAWRNVAALASKRSTVTASVVNLGVTSTPIPESYTTAAPIASTNEEWLADSGTYYYRIAVLHGPVDRRLARLIAEQSITVVQGGNAPFFSLSENALARPGYSNTTLYIERGAATGAYTHFVHVPLGNRISFFDRGYMTGHGFRWRPLAASILGELNMDVGFRKVDTFDSINCTVYGTNKLPRFGSFVPGDRFIGSAFEAVYQTAWRLANVISNADVGNANKAWTVADGSLCRLNAPLTAARTITLPKLADAIPLVVERTAAAGGAFDWIFVKHADDGGAAVTTIAAAGKRLALTPGADWTVTL